MTLAGLLCDMLNSKKRARAQPLFLPPRKEAKQRLLQHRMPNRRLGLPTSTAPSHHHQASSSTTFIPQSQLSSSTTLVDASASPLNIPNGRVYGAGGSSSNTSSTSESPQMAPSTPPASRQSLSANPLAGRPSLTLAQSTTSSAEHEATVSSSEYALNVVLQQFETVADKKMEFILSLGMVRYSFRGQMYMLDQSLGHVELTIPTGHWSWFPSITRTRRRYDFWQINTIPCISGSLSAEIRHWCSHAMEKAENPTPGSGTR